MRRCSVAVMSVVRPTLGLAALIVLAPWDARAQGTGGVRGTVYDSLGGVVSHVQVAIEGSKANTLTDTNGAFRFPSVPAGDVVLHMRRLGYRPMSLSLRVVAGSEAALHLELAPVPGRLPTVEIRRKAEAFSSRLAGFNERKAKQVGHFVTRETLDRMSSARFIDALRTMPGVSMRTLRGGVVTVALRGASCPPVVFVDGFPATAGVMDLDMIDLASVEGIEVYSGMATIPPQFLSVRGGESCGVIGIWSRPFRKRQRQHEPVSLAQVEKLIGDRKVYTAEQVDEPAVLAEGRSLSPSYPDSLWEAGISGTVVAEVIVDAKGMIEPGTLTIASASHPQFARMVRSALDDAVFQPGKVEGQAVRQMVQLPFRFERGDITQANPTSPAR